MVDFLVQKALCSGQTCTSTHSHKFLRHSECLSSLPTPTSISLSLIRSQSLLSLSLSPPISFSLFSPLCRSPSCTSAAKALLHRSHRLNPLLLPVVARHVGKFLFILVSLSLHLQFSPTLSILLSSHLPPLSLLRCSVAAATPTTHYQSQAAYTLNTTLCLTPQYHVFIPIDSQVLQNCSSSCLPAYFHQQVNNQILSSLIETLHINPLSNAIQTPKNS